MQQFEWIHAAGWQSPLCWKLLPTSFEVFRRLPPQDLRHPVPAAVLGAFSALSQAVKGIDLSVAYALWGGFGIAATIAAGWVLFGQRLNNKGWAGLSCW